MTGSGQTDFIDVPIRASANLALLLAAAHVAAIVAVGSVPLPWWLRLAGCSALLLVGVRLIRRDALLRAPDSVIGLRLMGDGSCEVRRRDQRVVSGQLCARWFVSPLMIVLRITRHGTCWPRGITLLPDAVDSDSLRQLRIFLRFAVEPSIGNE